MKPYKSRPVKTEESDDREQQRNGAHDWLFRSVLKNRKRQTTPLRFADVVHHKTNGLDSTGDRSIEPPSFASKLNQISISKAISKYLDHSGVLKDASQKRLERNKQQSGGSISAAEITPFSISNELEDFEEELSFKGASNRMHLLQKLDGIQSQAKQVFSLIKRINNNSSIDFITFKLFRPKEQQLKLSYYEFYSHLEESVKKVNDFSTELHRCRQIINKVQVGISKRTMELYITKFEDLIKELRKNVSTLQSYMELLNSLQKQEKKNTKKHLFVNKQTIPQRVI